MWSRHVLYELRELVLLRTIPIVARFPPEDAFKIGSCGHSTFLFRLSSSGVHCCVFILPAYVVLLSIVYPIRVGAGYPP